MKKRLISMVICMGLILALMPASPSEAVAKPKLSPGGMISIYTGKTKTITIKNVKKSDVKSLTVKALNKKSTKVVKKILTKKKVGFTLKAVGPHACVVKVTLKLKKKISGKKTYKFEITTCTGSPDAPDAVLSDGVTKAANDASVFKEGDAPEGGLEKWENYIKLDILNLADIDKRNIGIDWRDDEKEGKDISATGLEFRPDTTKVIDTETGYDERSVTCEVTNYISGKKTVTEEKKYRVVTQSYIDKVTKNFRDFAALHPVSSIEEEFSGKDATTIEKALMDEVIPFGNIMGLSWDTIETFYEMYEAAIANPDEKISTFFAAAIEDCKERYKLVAASIGVDTGEAQNFVDYLKVFIEHGIKNDKVNPVAVSTPDPTNASSVTVKLNLNKPEISRLRITTDSGRVFYTDSIPEFQSTSVVIDPKTDKTIRIDYQIWFFGYWDWTTWPIKEDYNLSPAGTIDVTVSDFIRKAYVKDQNGNEKTYNMYNEEYHPYL